VLPPNPFDTAPTAIGVSTTAPIVVAASAPYSNTLFIFILRFCASCRTYVVRTMVSYYFTSAHRTTRVSAQVLCVVVISIDKRETDTEHDARE